MSTQTPDKVAVMDQYWKEECAKQSAIARLGGYVSAFPLSTLQPAIAPCSCAVCMDEREKHAGVRSAGNLYLLLWETAVRIAKVSPGLGDAATLIRAFTDGSLAPLTADQLTEDVREAIERAGIDSLRAHACCGAGGLVYRSCFGEPNSQADVDAFVVKLSQRLADELGCSYAGFTAYEELLGPVVEHVASAVYYVTAPVPFNPLEVSALPYGLVVLRWLLGSEQAQREFTVALQIIAGHGFGDRFTAADPLQVVAVGEIDRNERDALTAILTAQFADRYQLSSLPVGELVAVPA